MISSPKGHRLSVFFRMFVGKRTPVQNSFHEARNQLNIRA